ncbi:MAG: hypothetical protein P8Z49_10900 [Acidobacteriota bacterium]|jgi:hypothetical protein
MRMRERGDGRLSLIVFLLILAGLIYFLVKWVPPRINAYQFRDYMSTWNTDPDFVMKHKNSEQIKEALLQKAKELNLPITAKDLSVSRNSDTVYIKANFTVPIDLKVYTFNQHYHFKEPPSS